MRHPLSIAVVATVLIAAVIDVFAAGVKTSAVTQFYYAAPASGVGIAVPPGMKFSTELLPQ